MPSLSTAIPAASVLLLLGLALRARVPALRGLFIPASVIGGVVGLAALQAAGAAPRLAAPARELSLALRGWPGPLIAVVFAGLLLERPQRRIGGVLRGAVQEGIVVWIIALGELAVGLAATWLIIDRFADVPPAFGQLIEAGFAGGHGTATALGVVYRSLNFPDGHDLGLFLATVGLVYGVVSGIVLVNVAVRAGWTRSGRLDLDAGGGPGPEGAEPIAFARVRPDVLDPLALQVALVATAMLLGAGLRWGAGAAAGLLPPGEARAALGQLPLFLFTLIGGLLLRRGLMVLGADHLIDGASIKRIVGLAMEYLIVAAVASLRLERVATYIGPLVILIALGAGWTAFCLLVISRRLLPAEHWFELGIINYGMSTATTAQGMMLLRIVDRDLETSAAEEYALAAPLSAPFVGGGVVTLTLPAILGHTGIPMVLAALVAALLALYALGRRLQRPTNR